MNPYLRNLNRIEFVVTMACTGKCKHCSQGNHNSTDKIDSRLAADAVRSIAGKYDIKSVMTFGGEPLLCPDTVFAVHKAATEMNIPKRQLITNGYFSKDISKIKSTAEMLSECGVNDILLSVDAFHQETIPVEIVKTFAKAVKDVSINIKVHPAWLVSPDSDNKYNNITRHLLDEFNQMGIESTSGNIIFPMGNALEYLSEYLDMNNEIENPYKEEPTDIKAICFSANGDILGSNIYRQDICEILSAYNPTSTDKGE